MTWFLMHHYESSWLDLRVVSWAAKYAGPQLLSWLKEKILGVCEKPLDDATSKKVRDFNSVVAWSAIRHDRVSVLAWICSQNFPRSVVEPLWRSRVLMLAAKSGHWRTLVWLRENDKIDAHQCNHLTGIAARYGHLQCLRRLERKWSAKCALEDALQAGRRGHLDVVEYLLKRHPELFDGREAHAREIHSLRQPYQRIMGSGHA